MAQLFVALSWVELGLDLLKYLWFTFYLFISKFINHTPKLSKLGMCTKRKELYFVKANSTKTS
jgi:hypothetical protein